MTDNEILLAMSGMLEPIRDNIQEMKSDLQEMKSDLLEMNNRVKKIEIVQENEIMPRLQNIEACYTSTYTRYKNSVDDYEMMRQDISLLKKVVAEHSEKLQKIS